MTTAGSRLTALGPRAATLEQTDQATRRVICSHPGALGPGQAVCVWGPGHVHPLASLAHARRVGAVDADLICGPPFPRPPSDGSAYETAASAGSLATSLLVLHEKAWRTGEMHSL